MKQITEMLHEVIEKHVSQSKYVFSYLSTVYYPIIALAALWVFGNRYLWRLQGRFERQ